MAIMEVNGSQFFASFLTIEDDLVDYNTDAATTRLSYALTCEESQNRRLTRATHVRNVPHIREQA